MFIDKEFQTRLCNEPLKSRLNLCGNMYSLNKIDEFMAYLDSIEANMSKKHLEAVHSAYGNWYEIPYTAMFDN